ncbi:serine/threonine-protein kinase [Lentisphaera profundi]|uniref:Serine/threonine-protein kinase n=1 Tax=Lentisphaera profundi TaxID=1658616 RepID=A0ABY7VYJ2_9BACT|nr:serine/threonine-protein kinase [Lentisphaera profundi]WDE99167.1 serine/threonine-protein kinase [Lentisphaera profundi]
MSSENKPSFPKRLLSLLGAPFSKSKGPNDTIAFNLESQEMSSTKLPSHLQDRYTVMRALGQGGYGVVYLVQDMMIGRLAAMKLLKRASSEGDAVFDHFKQEARIAGQLDHENIVVIFNAEYQEKYAFIIMEYLSEGNLASMIKEKGKFSAHEAVQIMKGILDGLSAAHRMRVVHRDVKPENILFDPKGRPKISDFGIAHLPKEEGGVLSDEEFMPVGTPCYMSPEQLAGKEDIDSRADLYSCGAILYEMLTGQKLYDIPRDMRLDDIYSMVKSENYKKLQDFKIDCPKDVENFVEKLLCVDRDQRYQSSMAALKDLNELLEKLDQEKETRTFPDRIVTSPIDLLEDVMRILLQDGIMAPAERREIDKRAERLRVSKDLTREIEEKIRKEMGLPSLDSLEAYESTYQLMGGDWDSMSHQEKEFLKKTSESLGLQDIERQMIEKDSAESRDL